MGKSTPATPDYVGAATETGQQNLAYLNAQTAANRPTQINPSGTSSWTQDASGNWTNTQTLSPEMQQLYDQYVGNVGAAGQTASGLLSKYNANNANMDMSQYVNAANATTTDAAQAALMAKQMPGLTQQKNALDASLAAQGLTLGSEAYNTGEDAYNRQYNDAQLNSITGAAGYQTQQLQNILQQYQLANAVRGQPLSDYNSLIGGTAVSNPTFSSFTNAGAATAPDMTSALNNQYTAALNSSNSSTATNAGLGTAAGSIAGSFFGPVGTGVGGALGGLIGGMF
jgi:hypothetical protein